MADSGGIICDVENNEKPKSIENQVEHNTWEIKLLQSRYESEQRARVQTGKIADQALRDLERVKDDPRESKDDNKELRKIMFGDNGLLMRLDRLEQRSSSGKENLRTGLSIGAILVTLWKVVSDYIKK